MSEHSSPGNVDALVRRIELARAFIAKEHADPRQEEYGDWINPAARPAHDALCLCLQDLATHAQAKPDRLVVAMEIWHRFAPEHVIEWEDEAHQAEYLFCADAILALPSTESTTLEGDDK